MADAKKGLKRRGNHSIYLTAKAEDLLARVAISTKRSQSEVVSMLVEAYGPELLGKDRPRQ